jgi:hypothetical protein
VGVCTPDIPSEPAEVRDVERPGVVLDFETRNTGGCKLKVAGAWRYAADPATEIITLTFHVAGVDHLWTPALGLCEPLASLVTDPRTVFVSHAGFEQAIWQCIMVERFGFAAIPIERWRDTQAACAYHALPLDLDRGLTALNLPVTKDKKGRALTLSLSRPNRKGFYPENTPEILQRVAEYNRIDVEGTVTLDKALGCLPERERRVWELDQRINQRGLGLDLGFIQAAKAMADRLMVEAIEECRAVTGLSPTQVQALRDWLNENRAELPNMQAATIEAALGTTLPDEVRRVLETRAVVSATSLKKFGSMLACVGSDNRARGLLQYHGATPGRWTGRLLQPQNFPRPTVKIDDPEELIAAVKTGDPEVLRRWGEPVEVLVSSLRYAIAAQDGALFGAGDFETIEARIVLALAGQYDRVEQLANGVDVYRDVAADIFRIDDKSAFLAIDKGDLTPAQFEQRQIGKNCVGADTEILTKRGWITISEVLLNDWLWDGIEWVQHSGLVAKGVQPTINLMGLSITPDHMMFGGEKSFPAAIVVVGGDIIQSLVSATGSKKLPLLDTLMARAEDCSKLLSDAVVEPNLTGFMTTTYEKENLPGVMRALRKNPGIGVNNTKDMLKSYQMMLTVRVFSTGSLPVSTDAITQEIGISNIMVDEESTYLSRGEQIDAPFSITLSPLMGGTGQNWNSIVGTTVGDMSPGTSSSEPADRTWQTGGTWRFCKPISVTWKPVYDLANAGPRQRFLVRAPTGNPLLISNTVLGCGFGLGWKGFRDKYCKGDDKLAQRIINTYRNRWAPKVPRLWYDLERTALRAMQCPGTIATAACGISYRLETKAGLPFLVCRLLNGKKIHYANAQLEMRESAWGKKRPVMTYWAIKEHRWRKIFAWHGHLTENLVQAHARELLVDAMFRFESRGFPVVLTVHDEVVVEHPQITREQVREIMSEPPQWAADLGLPVAVEAWCGKRYRK